MLSLFRTKTFIKEYKKIKFTDKLYIKYITYIVTLLKEEQLPAKATDHKLKGEYEDFLEFHISGNLLVIYRIKEKTLELIRIGSYSELFK